MSIYKTLATFSGLWRVLPATVLLLAVTGCGNQQTRPDTHELLNATLWAYTAAEYVASTTQAYHTATTNLDIALADPRWTAAIEQQIDYSGLPPAVMMDIDQTVLDNSLYNARIVTHHGKYTPETFARWCEEAAAPAVPGAKAFVDHAVERGVTVIYYSRRLESLRDCTTRNLATLGFPLSDQRYMLLNDKRPATKKAQLRSDFSSQFRILLLVGDDLEDFVAGSKTDSTVRRALAHQHADRWGREWIILPNPMYGAWDTSLYKFDYTMPRDRNLEIKQKHLAD